jgi:hypothetical protein
MGCNGYVYWGERAGFAGGRFGSGFGAAKLSGMSSHTTAGFSGTTNTGAGERSNHEFAKARLRTHSQNITTAARAQADMKMSAHRS